MFCSLSCKAKVAAASDFDPSKYIVIVFSEIRVPQLYRHVLNNVCYLLYFEIEMEVVYNLTIKTEVFSKVQLLPSIPLYSLWYNTCNNKSTLKKKETSVPSVAKQRFKRNNFNLPTLAALAAPLGNKAKMLLGTSKGSPRVIPGS